MKIGIYKIINPKGKIYIGQSINIDHTWKYRYKNIEGCKKQPKIYNSLKKYGPETHSFDIIEECSLEQLNERETHWKIFYLAQVQGKWSKVLFCELHDRWTGPKSEETKQKLRKPKYEGFGEKVRLSKINHICYQDPERGKKISKTSKGKPKPEGFGENLSLKLSGIIRSEETKQKMRKPKPEGFGERMRKPRGKYKLKQL